MRSVHFKIRDIDTNPKITGYTGYYTVVSFTLRTADGFMSSALKTDLNDKGEGIVYLPEMDDIEDEVLQVEFYGPGGYWISEKLTVSKTLFNASHNSGNKYEFKISVLKDNKLEKSFYTIRGRLVDMQNGTRVSRQPVYVFESKTTGTSKNDYRIVHALITDVNGYFKFEMPYEPDEKKRTLSYYAHVPVSTEKLLPFTMKRGLIEERQILGVQLSVPAGTVGSNEDGKDCACEDTPRLPNAEELARGEGVFSQDLGVGCVDFTKPNRVVEEYQFVQIIRTTDPQIKKVNLPTDTFRDILQKIQQELNPADVEIFYMKLPVLYIPPAILDGLVGGPG